RRPGGESLAIVAISRAARTMTEIPAALARCRRGVPCGRARAAYTEGSLPPEPARAFARGAAVGPPGGGGDGHRGQGHEVAAGVGDMKKATRTGRLFSLAAARVLRAPG